jgi:hypothetical protein
VKFRRCPVQAKWTRPRRTIPAVVATAADLS